MKEMVMEKDAEQATEPQDCDECHEWQVDIFMPDTAILDRRGGTLKTGWMSLMADFQVWATDQALVAFSEHLLECPGVQLSASEKTWVKNHVSEHGWGFSSGFRAS
jgi:hypothetical protein